MTWVRLEVAAFQDGRMLRAGLAGRVVFIAAVTMSKLHNWTRGEQRGYLPEKDFDPRSIAHHLGGIDDVPDPLAWLKTGLDACVREGLIEPVNGGWQISKWHLFQIDPTAAARVARHRERKREKHVPPKDYRTAVGYAGNSNKATEPHQNGHVEQHRTVTTVSNDDATGRDATLQSPPNPPHGGGLSASPGNNGSDTAATVPGERTAVAEILQRLHTPPKTPIRGPDIPIPKTEPQKSDPAKIVSLEAERARVLKLIADDEHRQKQEAASERAAESQRKLNDHQSG